MTSPLERKSSCEPLNMIFRKSHGPSNIGSHRQFLHQLRRILSRVGTVQSCCSTNWPSRGCKRVESRDGPRLRPLSPSIRVTPRTPINWTFPAFPIPIAIIYLWLYSEHCLAPLLFVLGAIVAVSIQSNTGAKI